MACSRSTVYVAPPDPLGLDVAGVDQLRDDALGRAFGDVHVFCDVAEPDVGRRSQARRTAWLVGYVQVLRYDLQCLTYDSSIVYKKSRIRYHASIVADTSSESGRAHGAERAISPRQRLDPQPGLPGPDSETGVHLRCPDVTCHVLVSLTLVEFDERRNALSPTPILASEHELPVDVPHRRRDARKVIS